MKLIIGNWKSNPSTTVAAIKLATAEDYEEVVISPPFQYLDKVGSLLKHAMLGAQDVFWEDGGSYTGEVSASQLRDLRVSHVIVGHSERRIHLGETDDVINKKIKIALDKGLKVVLCVGEPIQVRKLGIKSAKDFITDQIKNGLRGVKKSDAKKVIIAYEPVWAVGTGTPDIPEETAEICAYIKNLVSIERVVYGGSVNAKNAKEFLGQDDIDGALVGGASLNPKEFQKIVEIAHLV